MKASELRRLFIDFFVKNYSHAEIKGSSLIPENDPTVLFTTAGMHPLVPFLMGEKHPAGQRLVNVQKCIRTDDIEEVGDDTHLTFFEMLGNWSLGDFFKEEAIEMSYNFLTRSREAGGLGFAPERLMVTCFAGDSDAPLDDEAATAWEKLGFTRFDQAKVGAKKLIFFYEKKKNWWGPAGQTGPCGPDTEMFYDRCPDLDSNEHRPDASEDLINKYPLEGREGSCHPNCECGRYVEIWNDVFMQYNKLADGSYEPLKQQNVDTGMGFERALALVNGEASVFETELFREIIEEVRLLGGYQPDGLSKEEIISERIIADHLRAATFIIGDDCGVTPSNTDQGYILRRLIRRAIHHGRKLGITGDFVRKISGIVVKNYGDFYQELLKNQELIFSEMAKEEAQFLETLNKGLQVLKKEMERQDSKKDLGIKAFDEDFAFQMLATYGFPLEMTMEELESAGWLSSKADKDLIRANFDTHFSKHQALSRAGAERKFSGGLADHSYETTRLHTATHLLHQALRTVLGTHVEQKGSNITAERLRFDFSHPDKMTDEEKKKVEDMVNEEIQKGLEVVCSEMTVSEAKEKGAMGLFESKYGDRVKVYSMGKGDEKPFSIEICGGPHVENTNELKHFKILKEESSSNGVRRIKAVVG